jgi:hypothetical protein
MPLRPDPARPGWLTLLDGRGRPVGSFLRAERDGRPLADLFEAAIAPDEAVPAILAELRGWRVAADEPLARALVAAEHRHPRARRAAVRRPMGDPRLPRARSSRHRPRPARPGAAHRRARRAAGLGLAVTHGNPAARLYEDLGFRRILSGMSVDL